MTYISRRTRIIVSRWTDECDADYILRAVRKRSDGRIKRYSSCFDLRAWVNDFCIKHEHLVDLMSDGEFSAGPPFRLYGRFIPVPILFKLMQNFGNNDVTQRRSLLRKRSIKDSEDKKLIGRSANEKLSYVENAEESNKSENPDLERTSSLSRVQWEKSKLEKSLYESTNLLNEALGKLEKIDNIVDLAKEESENAKNEEIQFASRQSQNICEINSPNQTNDSNVSGDLSSSRTYIKKLQNSTKCNELLRKISGLREKLKKIQECRQIITRQIHMSRVRAVKCESTSQVTELYSRREETHVRKLKKKLEKLISERGRLLSEMCEALNNLNALKRNVSTTSNPRSSREEKFKGKLGQSPSCACGCDCSVTSTEFEKYNSESPESDFTECVDNSKGRGSWIASSEGQIECPQEMSTSRAYYDNSSRNSGILRNGSQNDSVSCYEETPEKSPQQHSIVVEHNPPSTSNQADSGSTQRQSKSTKDSHRTSVTIKEQPHKSSAASRPSHIPARKNSKPSKPSKPSSESVKKNKKQSKVNFADEENPCRKKFYQEDFSAYEKNLSPQQQKVIQGAVRKMHKPQTSNAEEKTRRPRSSPTTDSERHTVSVERRRHDGRSTSVPGAAPERRVKSETTMQEIEKTLRNYEQRLRKYDALEHKIEQIRQKVSEMNRMKLEWQRNSNEGQKEAESERERSSKEIKKLSTENWALKRQVQRLMAKFEVQCKKIQTLKSNAQKNWELECETEELKKELLKYRDKFEHQRKCITEWENVVVLQRKEIENLMNHIRRMSTGNNYSAKYPSLEKKNVQRSRSYSPELLKPQRNLKANTCVKVIRSSSEDEDESYYCDEYPQLEYRRGSRQENSNRKFCSPCRGINW